MSGSASVSIVPGFHLLIVVSSLFPTLSIFPLEFSAPLLLVEGDDDFRIWSEIPRRGLLNMAVIPCNGEEIYEYQRTLDGLFESILEETEVPAGYALLDGDKSQRTTNQKHIKFIKLSCHESENLYLTDEVLEALKYDWSAARKKYLRKVTIMGGRVQNFRL